MAKIAQKLTELIGNTPLLQLSNYAEGKNLEANVIVKLESYNPAGCVKERNIVTGKQIGRAHV